jgi:aldose 1-epimerase
MQPVASGADMEPLSGTQFELSAGDYRATIASVGASLRELTWQSRHLVVPFEADEVRPQYRGAVLSPWPNRVVDGRYEFDGVEYQLALTEPERGHALHGLAGWQDFAVITQEASAVSLSATVPPPAGYPFRLRLVVTYSLTEQGLTISLEATNTGQGPAPFGAGFHPYLCAGPGVVNDWILELPAASVLAVTPDRLVPLDLHSVTESASQFDFRRPRIMADTFLDHAFTDLSAGTDGLFAARLTAGGGRGVAITWGAECGWVQVHTADRPEPETHRIGLAVEPMTCPPDAFNSGRDLKILPVGGASVVQCRMAGF